MRSSPLCFLLLPAVLLSACSDATGPVPSGSMSFTYQGSAPGSPSGSFSVEGSGKPSIFDAAVTGAMARRSTGEDSQFLDVSGSSAAQSQYFSITIYGAPGVGMLPSCEVATTDCVEGGYFRSGTNSSHWHGPGQYTQPPYPEVTVTITEITESRVRGTFKGMVIGYCNTCPDPLAPDTLTISAGQFDVPFRQ